MGKGEDLIPFCFWEEVFCSTYEERGTERGQGPLWNPTSPISPAFGANATAFVLPIWRVEISLGEEIPSCGG